MFFGNVKPAYLEWWILALSPPPPPHPPARGGSVDRIMLLLKACESEETINLKYEKSFLRLLVCPGLYRKYWFLKKLAQN